VAFRPTAVHAKQRLRPVLRFGPAGARVDGDDGVELVVFSGEKGLGFQALDQPAEFVKVCAELIDDVLPLARQFEVGAQVRKLPRQALVIVERLLEPPPPGHDSLGIFLVLPKVGAGYLFFDGFDFAAALGGVKENSASRRLAV